MFKKLSIAAAIALMFAGCVVEEDLVTGKFVDREVDGIKYSCGGREGETKNGGLFECPRGSSVEFWLDGVNLGGVETVEGGEIVTPKDFDFIILRGKKRPLDNKEKERLAPLVATVLLSLDKDGNPDNGIEIDNKVEDAFGKFFDAEVKPEAVTNIVELFKEEQPDDPLKIDPDMIRNKILDVTQKALDAVEKEVPEADLRPITLDEAEKHLDDVEEAIRDGEIKPPVEETTITGAEGGA